MCLQVRKHIYHDADNLDTAFDAGGKVSIGLTATTIVSQWTWSATLLQSSTVASKVKNSWKIPLGSQSLRSVFLKKMASTQKVYGVGKFRSSFVRSLARPNDATCFVLWQCWIESNSFSSLFFSSMELADLIGMLVARLFKSFCLPFCPSCSKPELPVPRHFCK